VESLIQLRKGKNPRRLLADLDGLEHHELGRGTPATGWPARHTFAGTV
jgi:hypothetical protein